MTYPSGDQPGPPYQPPGQPYQPQYAPPQQPYQPYPQQYGAGAPSRPRGRTPLWLALIFGVVGIALLIVGGVVGFSQGLQKVDGFQRVSLAQRSATLHFAAGNYLAYYEAPDYNTNSNTVPVVDVQMRNVHTGQFVGGQLYGGGANHKVKSLTYDYNGHHGAALYQFTIKQGGAYVVAVAASPGSSASPRADIAFGKSIAGGLAAGGIVAIVGVLLIIAAIVLLIVGLVQRSRSRKRIAAAQGYGGPTPGYGYPPPPHGNWGPPPQ
jgi:hypothetical protein